MSDFGEWGVSAGFVISVTCGISMTWRISIHGVILVSEGMESIFFISDERNKRGKWKDVRIRFEKIRGKKNSFFFIWYKIFFYADEPTLYNFKNEVWASLLCSVE
jgi:hypothetical protein